MTEFWTEESAEAVYCKGSVTAVTECYGKHYACTFGVLSLHTVSAQNNPTS